MKKILISLTLFCGCCNNCDAGTKTYYNRNGSVQFRATTQGNTVKTTDSRGCYSGTFRSSGSSVTQTNPGFKAAKPNSSFGNKR